MEKKRSLGVNFIFNMMRTMMGVIIPLITFPYSSRVLGPEALGKVDYAQANMTYFTLLQAFGIGGYAIREGARIRDDRKKKRKEIDFHIKTFWKILCRRMQKSAGRDFSRKSAQSVSLTQLGKFISHRRRGIRTVIR